MELQANTLDAVVIDQPVAMLLPENRAAGKDLKIVGTQKGRFRNGYSHSRKTQQAASGRRQQSAEGTESKTGTYEQEFMKNGSESRAL